MIAAHPESALAFEHRVGLIRRLRQVEPMRVPNYFDQLAPEFPGPFIRA
jgi:hypothetical protein